MKLIFNVCHQMCVRQDMQTAVADSTNYLMAKFTFETEDWNNTTKTAVFKNGPLVKNVILDANNECAVPAEVIDASYLYVSVFGVKDPGYRITTNFAMVQIDKSGYLEGDGAGEITPSQVEQLEGAIAEKTSPNDFKTINGQNIVGSGNLIIEGSGTEVVANPEGTATDSLTKIQIGEEIFNIPSGGTNVEANPTATATAELSKIKVGNDVYEIPEGTVVEANPQGTASTDLTKLKVGTGLFNIPSGDEVVANPTLAGTETDLSGIEVNGTKFKVPSGDGAIIDDNTPSATKVFSSEKVNETYLGKTAELVNALVVADSVARSSSGATVTRVDDNTYTVECNNTWCGDQRNYNLSDIGSNGITLVFDFVRATGDANNAINFSVYSKQSASDQKSMFTFALPADTQSVHYEIGIADATIQRDKWGDQFVILIGTQKVRIINESIVVRKGSTLLTPNVEQIKESVYTPLVGRKIIFLGDSITALNNERSWVNAFCTLTGASKIVDVAVDGAYLADNEGTVYDGDPKYSDATNNVLGNQVQKIINNQYEAPDIIIIAIGTNGGITADDATVKATYFSGTSLVPLADVDRTTTEGAFRYCNETLHNLYPDALIVWCSPIQSKISHHRVDAFVEYSEALKKLTAYGSSHFCDTLRCGIHMANEASSNGEYTIDGLHPNAKGAMRIARYNADAICSMMGIGSRYKDNSMITS